MRYNRRTNTSATQLILLFVILLCTIFIASRTKNAEDASIWKKLYVGSINYTNKNDSIKAVESERLRSCRDSLFFSSGLNIIYLDSIKKLNKKVTNYRWEKIIKSDSTYVKN